MVDVRQHKGSLDESMETLFRVVGRQELLTAIQNDFAPFGVNIADQDVAIRPYAYDARIDWDTHIITVKGHGVYGFSNGPVPSP